MYRLSVPPIWFDEAVTWRNATNGLGPLLRYARQGDDCGGVVYSALLSAWTALFGSSEAALRFPSLLFAVGFVAVMMALGRHWWNRTASVCMGLLAALHPAVLIWSRVARAYMLEVLLVGVCLLGLASWFDHRRARGAGYWLLSAGCLLVLSHVFGVFVIAGLFLSLLGLSSGSGEPERRWRRLRDDLWPVAVPLLVAAVWVLLMRTGVETFRDDFWVKHPISSGYLWTLPKLVPGPLVTAPLLMVALAVMWRKPASSTDPRAAAMICVTGATILLGPLVASFLSRGSHHFVFSRYFLSFVPLVVVAAGYFCSRWGRVLGIVAALSLSALWWTAEDSAWHPGSHGWHGDTRSPAEFIRLHCPPGARVLIAPAHLDLTFRYYGADAACSVEGVPPTDLLRRARRRDSVADVAPGWVVVHRRYFEDVAKPLLSSGRYELHGYPKLVILQPRSGSMP